MPASAGQANEATGFVDDEAVVVDGELAYVAVGQPGASPRTARGPLVANPHHLGSQRLDIHRHHGEVGPFTDAETEATDRERGGERGTGQLDVGASVELAAVAAVHLAPMVVGVDGEPQVGLVEIAEQHELAHVPGGCDTNDVLHVLAPDPPARRPRLVLPLQRERLHEASSAVAVAVAGARPLHAMAVGRERAEVGHANTLNRVITLAEAQRTVLGACPPLTPVDVDRTAALGLVLAADVVAGEDVPPFANSAVDGYAVRAADVGASPVELAVVAEVAAGSAAPAAPLRPGEAVRLMTGAPIPAGADAVVMVERTERLDDGSRVRVRATAAPGDAVRPAGSDVRTGDVVFTAGTAVTPAVAGVLASINARTVPVHPAVRVGVLSTGDELVVDGGPLAPGQIRESNLTMLEPLLTAAGCRVRSYGVVMDDEEALERVLTTAATECDAIVTSGGVSMGDYDVVKAVLGRIAEMEWMQVAIKPAKPFAFGTLAGAGDRAVPVFGLPGNPVSSLVSFEMFARPALRRMMGHRRLARPSVVAVTDADLQRRPDGRTHLMRAVAEFGDDGRVHVVPVGAQGSHQLAATALANALVVVDDGDGVPAGAEVAALLLDAG